MTLSVMSPPTPIQIFRPGRHVAMSGAALEFSESDLAACAAAYDPARHEAPIVIGHPQTDGPAYGWVKSLAFGESLEATPDQVDPAFAEMVSAGRFKKISASFYQPDSPQNPVPGVYYLRHVGFLGAQPPAVKGLRAPQFSEAETGVVSFADLDDVINAGLWRGLRDWLISTLGLEKAQAVIPDYAVGQLEQLANQPDESDADATPLPSPAFVEPTPHQETAVSPEEKAALESENASLKARLAEAETRDKAAAATARRAEAAQYCEGLIAAGKLLPAERDTTLAILDLAATSGPVFFGEGDAKTTDAPLARLKALLSGLPVRVTFGEVASGRVPLADTVSFAAPDRFQVDAANLEIHRSALAYRAAHPEVDYLTAVKTVQTGA